MPVLFALILYGNALYPNEAFRVGDYEKLQQCEQQGRDLLKISGRAVHFRCVPVNR